MRKETHFQDSWLYKEEFQEWLVKGKENTQAKCRRYQKIIELSNMGIQAMRSHVGGKKHLKINHKVPCFFKKSRAVEKEENNKAESVAEKGPKKCTQMPASSEVAKAEIALKCLHLQK